MILAFSLHSLGVPEMPTSCATGNATENALQVTTMELPTVEPSPCQAGE